MKVKGNPPPTRVDMLFCPRCHVPLVAAVGGTPPVPGTTRKMTGGVLSGALCTTCKAWWWGLQLPELLIEQLARVELHRAPRRKGSRGRRG